MMTSPIQQTSSFWHQALDFDILGVYTIERIWNSGVGAEIVPIGQVAYPNSTIDDVGFINALVDSMISQYQINTMKFMLPVFNGSIYDDALGL